MPPRVVIYQVRQHHRSRVVCEAMAAGLRAHGLRFDVAWADQYAGPTHDIAIFYGLESKLGRALADYPAAGRHAFYIDLGYFGRREGGRWCGYHKIVLDGRHPTPYFLAVKPRVARFRRFGIVVRSWRARGRHIVLAGMGDKGARADGFEPEAWEMQALREIRQYTNRDVIYRPKPSWKKARPLPGCGYSPASQDCAAVLAEAWAVVTHHSNVAVDGLLGGIPAFCWEGVAMPMASQSLAEIEAPRMPEGREAWAEAIAHTQWNIREMHNGEAWAHCREVLLSCT